MIDEKAQFECMQLLSRTAEHQAHAARLMLAKRGTTIAEEPPAEKTTKGGTIVIKTQTSWSAPELLRGGQSEEPGDINPALVNAALVSFWCQIVEQVSASVHAGAGVPPAMWIGLSGDQRHDAVMQPGEVDEDNKPTDLVVYLGRFTVWAVVDGKSYIGPKEPARLDANLRLQRNWLETVKSQIET